MNFNSKYINYEILNDLSSKKDIKEEALSILQNIHNYSNQIISAESEKEKQKIEEEKHQYLEAFKSDKDSETILEIAKCFAFIKMYMFLEPDDIKERDLNMAKAQYDILSILSGQNKDNQEFEKIKENAAFVIDFSFGFSPILKLFVSKYLATKKSINEEALEIARIQQYENLAKDMKSGRNKEIKENSEQILDFIYASEVYNACNMLESIKEKADSVTLEYQASDNAQREFIDSVLKTAVEAEIFKTEFLLKGESQVEGKNATANESAAL